MLTCNTAMLLGTAMGSTLATTITFCCMDPNVKKIAKLSLDYLGRTIGQAISGQRIADCQETIDWEFDQVKNSLESLKDSIPYVIVAVPGVTGIAVGIAILFADAFCPAQ